MQHRNYTLFVTFTLLLLPVGCSDSEQVSVTPHPTSVPAARPAASETLLTPTRDATAETKVQISESSDTLTGTNLRLADLTSVAYRTPENPKNLLPLMSAERIISATPLPADRYDVRIVVPGGNAARLRAALRQTLETQFGLSVRRELREAAALVLMPWAGRAAAGVRRAAAEPKPGTRRLTFSGTDLSLLTEQLEERMQRPVVNEAARTGAYELILEQPSPEGQPPLLDLPAVQTALREQLGLDLVPGRRTIEFLVVSRRE